MTTPILTEFPFTPVALIVPSLYLELIVEIKEQSWESSGVGHSGRASQDISPFRGSGSQLYGSRNRSLDVCRA